MTRRLPTISIRGQTYTVDERLRQLRNVDDMADCMEFDKFEQACAVAVLNAKAAGDLRAIVDVMEIGVDYDRACNRMPSGATRAMIEELRHSLAGDDEGRQQAAEKRDLDAAGLVSLNEPGRDR